MAEAAALPPVKEDTEEPDPLIVLVGDVSADADIKEAIKTLKLKYEESENGLDFIRQASRVETVFILSEFEGDVFHKLHKAEARIVGPPILLQCARDNTPIPFHNRPLYCLAMKKVIVCFTGFDRKEEVGPLAALLHHMGGSVRKDITPKVTHLIANCTDGSKYRVSGC